MHNRKRPSPVNRKRAS